MTAYNHLLDVDLGHRAGKPPPHPYVSKATRERVRQEHTDHVCALLGLTPHRSPGDHTAIVIWPPTQ